MRKQPRDSYLDTSDGTLVQLSLAGDHEALESLVERYHAPLVDYISRRCMDESLVQDIVQHVLLQLYVSLKILQAQDPLIRSFPTAPFATHPALLASGRA